MKTPSGYVCDWEDCPSVKGPTNGWWLMYEIGQLQAPMGLVLSPWVNDLADFVPTVKHLCGAACAAKAQAEWIHVQMQRARMLANGR